MHRPSARLERIIIQVQVLQRDAAVGVRPAGRQRAVQVVLRHIVVQHIGWQRRRQRALHHKKYKNKKIKGFLLKFPDALWCGTLFRDHF